MKWALVLAGGGARGLAHIGVLETLLEMDVPEPSLIVGCSMGAIIGGLYASGMSAQEMRKYVGKHVDLTDYMSDAEWKPAELPLGKVFRIGNGITNLFSAPGIDSGKRALQILRDMSGDINIEQLRIPFCCNATDLCTGKEIVFDKGPLAEALRASSSFPGVFAPYKKDGMLLSDGYLSHNLPVWIARKKGYRKILAVNLADFNRQNQRTMRTAVDVLLRAFDCAMNRQTEHYRDRPTATIIADNDRSPLDFRHPDKQIDFGRDCAREQQDRIRRFFGRHRGRIK